MRATKTSFLFSDSFRFLKIAALLAMLLASCWYSHATNPARTAAYFTNIPEGAHRTLTHFEITLIDTAAAAMVVSIPDGRFPLRVRPVPASAAVGDIVNLEVIMRDGELNIIAHEIRKRRALKIWVSLPALVLIAGLLRAELTWDKRRKMLTQRHPRLARRDALLPRWRTASLWTRRRSRHDRRGPNKPDGGGGRA